MSSTVEERVVEMQFDNKQFESNAKETMKTLDALNKSLELKGATDGFKNLDKAAKSVDLSDISKSMDAITNKISVFGVIGDQVLRNLTNRAADFAMKWAKDLTIGQVQKGWSKYEAKTNAVQVIMHATGQTIDEVNESLNDLTWYTDQTSYSFDQMIDAISKFTGAGVVLDDAEKMAEGIANWAASAGVSASKAAPAFYNLSQAMSSGALRAQDWKSIELLNMNTVEFEEKAIEIAEAMIKDGRASQEMATAFNKAKPKVQGFRDSLSTGWLSKEVMTELFKAYADRSTEFGNAAFQAAYEAKSFTDAVEAAKEAVASGWANIFEQIFGNYEEAKVFWTEVADAMIEVFSAPTTALADLLTEWHKDGGYVAFIDSIRNSWAAVKSVGEAVAETFRNVIPPLTSDKLVGVTERLEKLTRSWRNFTTKIDVTELIDPEGLELLEDGTVDLSKYKKQIDEATKHNEQVDKNLQSLRETFEGVFAVFKLAGTVTSALFKIALPFTRLLVPIAKIVGSITSALGRMSSAIVDAILGSEIFNGILGFLEKTADKAASGLTWLGNKLASFIDILGHIPIVERFISLLQTLYANLKELAAPYINIAISRVTEFFNSVKSYISQNAPAFFSQVASAIKNLGGALLTAGRAAVAVFGPALDLVWGYILKMWSGLKGLGSKIVDFWNNTIVPTGVFQWLIGAIDTFANKVKYFSNTLIEYIRNGGIAAALQWLKGLFVELIWQIRHINLGEVIVEFLGGASMVRILSMVLTLMKILKPIKTLSNFFESFPKVLKGFTKNLGIKRIASSILMLALALFFLAQIDTGKLFIVSGVLLVMSAALVAFAIGLSYAEGLLAKNKLSNTKGTAKAIAAMLVIAASALLLAIALKKIAEIGSFTDMMSAVVALLAVVGVLVGGAMVMTMGGKSLMAAGIGLLAMVVAIILVVTALDKIVNAFNELKAKTEGLNDNLLNIGISIAAVSIALGVIYLIAQKVASGLWQVAAVIASIGVAILLIAYAVERMSKLDTQTLEKAVPILITLTLAILALAAISRLFKGGNAKSFLGMGVAVVAMAITIATIITTLKALTEMDSEKLKKAIAEFVVIMLALTAALIPIAFIKPGATSGLAATIIAIIAALWLLTRQDLAKLIPAVVMLGTVLMLLGFSLLIAAPALRKANFSTFVGLAAIIAIIAGSIGLLARFTDAGNLIAAALAMGGVLLAFGISMLMAQKALNQIDLPALAMSILVIIAIAASLVAVANMPFANILAAAHGLSMVLVVLAISMNILAKSGASATGKEVVVKMLGVVLVLGAIAGALAWLANYDIKHLIASTIAMSTLLIIVGLMAGLIAKVKAPNAGDSFRLAGMITAVLLPIVVALAAAKHFISDPSGIVAIATAMAEIVAALALPIAAIGLMGKMGIGSEAAGSGFLGFAKILTGLVLLFGIIGTIAHLGEEYLNFSLVEEIQRAGQILTAVGEAIGGLVGGIVAGAVGAVVDSLPGWGESINQFLGSIATGVASLSEVEIDEGKMAGLESLAHAILVLTAAEILDGIASFISGGTDFATFAEGVAAMGPALKTFAEDTDGVDGEKIKPVAEAISVLSDVARNLGRTGGIISKVLGYPKSLATFAGELAYAAPKLNEFATAVSQPGGFAMQDKKVKAAGEAISSLIDIANKLPRTGGWLQEVIGEVKSLPQFCQELVTALPDITKFAQAAPEIAKYKGQMSDVASVMSELVAVANALNPLKESFLWGAYTTEAQDIGTFFSAFSDSTSEIEVTAGDRKILGLNLGTKKGIATSLNEFAKTMKEIDMEGLQRGKEAIDLFVQVADAFATSSTSIEVLGGLFSYENEEVNGLQNFASDLAQIAPSLGEFSNVITNILDVDAFGKFATAMKKLATVEVWLADLGEGLSIETFASTLINAADDLSTASANAEEIDYGSLDTMFAWFSDNKDSIIAEGTSAVQAVQNAMKTAAEVGAISIADATITPVLERLTSATNDQKARAAGKFLVDGFAAGITANIHTAMAAAGNLSEATIQQMRRTLRIGSPSRVARQIGGWTGEGFVIGMSDWLGASGKTGEALAESVTNSAEATLDYLSRLLNGEMVVSMTIRPVMDLTDVRNGAMAIDSMFTQRQAVMAQLDAGALDQSNEIAELIDVSWKILREIQNGRDIYLDGKVLAGSMNRRLGRMEGL